MKVEEKINKNKKIILYSILVVSFIICIFISTYYYLNVRYKYKGEVNYTNSYYDVKVTDATIDYETTTKVIISDDVIEVNIDDLYRYSNTNSINVELYNIGNIDAIISNIFISNIDTNVKRDDIKINLSLKNNDMINARSKKILRIDITNNSVDTDINDYLNFNINVNYREVVK